MDFMYHSITKTFETKILSEIVNYVRSKELPKTHQISDRVIEDFLEYTTLFDSVFIHQTTRAAILKWDHRLLSSQETKYSSSLDLVYVASSGDIVFVPEIIKTDPSPTKENLISAASELSLKIISFKDYKGNPFLCARAGLIFNNEKPRSEYWIPVDLK